MDEDDKDISESFQKIKTVLETSRTPSLEGIMRLLYRELSPATTVYITDLTKKYKRIYSKKMDKKYFTKFMTRIYFPKENYCFICSRSLAKQIPVIKNIIEGKFKEHPLNIKYYDYDESNEVSAGKLVICTCEIASILLPTPTGEMPKILLDFIQEY